MTDQDLEDVEPSGRAAVDRFADEQSMSTSFQLSDLTSNFGLFALLTGFMVHLLVTGESLTARVIAIGAITIFGLISWTELCGRTPRTTCPTCRLERAKWSDRSRIEQLLISAIQSIQNAAEPVGFGIIFLLLGWALAKIEIDVLVLAGLFAIVPIIGRIGDGYQYVTGQDVDLLESIGEDVTMVGLLGAGYATGVGSVRVYAAAALVVFVSEAIASRLLIDSRPGLDVIEGAVDIVGRVTA